MTLPEFVPIKLFSKRMNYYINVDQYPNNEPYIKSPYKLPKNTVMLLRPQNMTDFVAGMFYADAMRDRGTPIKHLVIPLVPGSRQDRLNDEGDLLFTVKSVAKMINDRKFESVHVLDPHSDVTPALIKNCVVYHADEIIRDSEIHGGSFTSVIVPDAGAAKRAQKVAKLLHLPIVQAWKERDVETGRLSGFGIEPYADLGPHPLIVDDLCDGGGTFNGLVDHVNFTYGQMDKRRDACPEVYTLYVTHGLFTSGVAALENIDNIITTDSVKQTEHYNLTVLPTSEDIAKGIVK